MWQLASHFTQDRQTSDTGVEDTDRRPSSPMFGFRTGVVRIHQEGCQAVSLSDDF